MKTEFLVITKTPRVDHKTKTVSSGNLAAAILFVPVGDDTYKVDFAASIVARCEVFTRGEILIVDESGREVSGRGRKPDKWDVEYLVVDDLEEALKISRRVDAIRMEELKKDE